MRNLLPVIDEVTEMKQLSSFQHKRIGINGHDWLYRACSHFPLESRKHHQHNVILTDLSNRLKYLTDNQIIPVVVFNGTENYSYEKIILVKNLKNHKRKQYKKGKKLIGDDYINEAYPYFLDSIKISFKLVKKWINSLSKDKIEYFVSPTEANAQLSYFLKLKKIDFVLADSLDVLIFLPETVLFMNDKNNNVVLIVLKRVLDLLKINNIQFMTAICLAGHSLFNKVSNMGILRALKIVKEKKSIDDVFMLLKEKNCFFNVSFTFDEHLKRAIKGFLTMNVYDPNERKVVQLLSALELDYNMRSSKSINEKCFLINLDDLVLSQNRCKMLSEELNNEKNLLDDNVNNNNEDEIQEYQKENEDENENDNDNENENKKLNKKADKRLNTKMNEASIENETGDVSKTNNKDNEINNINEIKKIEEINETTPIRMVDCSELFHTPPNHPSFSSSSFLKRDFGFGLEIDENELSEIVFPLVSSDKSTNTLSKYNKSTKSSSSTNFFSSTEPNNNVCLEDFIAGKVDPESVVINKTLRRTPSIGDIYETGQDFMSRSQSSDSAFSTTTSATTTSPTSSSSNCSQADEEGEEANENYDAKNDELGLKLGKGSGHMAQTSLTEYFKLTKKNRKGLY